MCAPYCPRYGIATLTALTGNVTDSPPIAHLYLSLAESNSLIGHVMSELSELGMKNAVGLVLRILGYGA
jgi:hypothetical protein